MIIIAYEKIRLFLLIIYLYGMIDVICDTLLKY